MTFCLGLPGMQQLEEFSSGRAAAGASPGRGRPGRGRRCGAAIGERSGSWGQLSPGHLAGVPCGVPLGQCFEFLGLQSHSSDWGDRKLFRGPGVWTQV